MPDDGLDYHAGDRGRQPEIRQMLHVSAERLQDTAHIGILQG
jgi:hypothetical protein